MSYSARTPSAAGITLALCLGLLLGSLGCGAEGSREEMLEAANEAVSEAEGLVATAAEELEKREAALETATESREAARKALKEAQSKLGEAQAAVGLHATDDVLFRSVQKALLEDPKLEEVAIAASVTEGVVTLTGKVPNAALRDHAIEVAGAVAGVVKVRSAIEVPAAKAKPDQG